MQLTETTLAKIRRQNDVTRRDLPSRVLSISILLALCAFYTSALAVVPIVVLYAFLEVFGLVIYRRIDARNVRADVVVLLVSAFIGSSAFAALAILLEGVQREAAYYIGTFSLITAILHCVFVRTTWIPFGVVTVIPLISGLFYVVGSRLSRMTSITEVAICGVLFLVMLAYLVHAMNSMHRTRRRILEASAEASLASEAKSRFIAAMSHEIRTPLNAIQGIAELLLDDPADPDVVSERARLLSTSTVTLRGIVDDILDHAKIAAGRYDLKPVTANLTDEVGHVIEMFRGQAHEKGLALDADFAPGIPPAARVDAQRVRQVLGNLLSNAVKYTDRGRITVRVVTRVGSEGGWFARIDVADTGAGIPEAQLEQLFQDFSRLENPATISQTGTGLGLVISRGFARLMGGDVTVSSTLGRGSTFSFTFRADACPAAQRAVQQVVPLRAGHRAQSAEARPQIDAQTDLGLLGAVLVVDDNRANRYIIRSFLKGLATDLVEAANGKEALEAIEAQPFDVVFLDMKMPVLDGPATFAEMQARGGRVAGTPVISFTGDAAAGDRFLALGIQGYVPKPTTKKDLLAELERVMTLARAAA